MLRATLSVKKVRKGATQNHLRRDCIGPLLCYCSRDRPDTQIAVNMVCVEICIHCLLTLQHLCIDT